jgi:hypothetical protein
MASPSRTTVISDSQNPRVKLHASRCFLGTYVHGCLPFPVSRKNSASSSTTPPDDESEIVEKMSMKSFMMALFIAAMQTIVAGQSSTSDPIIMQVNYYSDQGCKTYKESWNISVSALRTCLQYHIPGSGSFNIANCNTVSQYTGCQCTWYPEPNCQGVSFDAAGMLANGRPLNTHINDPSELLIETCASTNETILEPVGVICRSGWYV